MTVTFSDITEFFILFTKSVFKMGYIFTGCLIASVGVFILLFILEHSKSYNRLKRHILQGLKGIFTL